MSARMTFDEWWNKQYPKSLPDQSGTKPVVTNLPKLATKLHALSIALEDKTAASLESKPEPQPQPDQKRMCDDGR